MANIPKSQDICTIEQASTNSRKPLDRFVVTFERVLGFIQLIDQQQTVVRISQFLTKKLNKKSRENVETRIVSVFLPGGQIQMKQKQQQRKWVTWPHSGPSSPLSSFS